MAGGGCCLGCIIQVLFRVVVVDKRNGQKVTLDSGIYIGFLNTGGDYGYPDASFIYLSNDTDYSCHDENLKCLALVQYKDNGDLQFPEQV